MRSGEEPKTVERHHHENCDRPNKCFVPKTIPKSEIIQRFSLEKVCHHIRCNIKSVPDRKCSCSSKRGRDLPAQKPCAESHDSMREDRSEFKRRSRRRNRIEERPEDAGNKPHERTEEETTHNRHHHVDRNHRTRNERVRLN